MVAWDVDATDESMRRRRVNTMLLLPDGTVMAADGGNGWYKLTPDSSGSYA